MRVAERQQSLLRRIVYLLFPTFFLLMAFGCGRKDTAALKWGHLPRSMSDRLISLPPESKISVCGYRAPAIAQAITAWAKVIGRDAYLHVDSDCQSGNVRKIVSLSPTESDPYHQCSPDKVAAYTDGHTVKYCSEYSEEFMGAIALHEVGHIWGICDQYNDGMNCDSENRGPTDPTSVMGGGGSGAYTLQSDDIEGIKQLAQRRDIPANLTWSRFLAERNGQPPKPTPPTVATPSPTPTVDSPQNPVATPSPTPIPTSTPTPSPGSNSYAAWCSEAGGSWTDFKLNDGFMRCDCKSMLYRQDVLGFYGKTEFQRLCKLNLKK